MQRVRVSSRQSPVHKLGHQQVAFSPNFKLVMGKHSDIKESLLLEPLVPDLPDDIALNCLLRLPISMHSSCRSVCKRWYFLFRERATVFSLRNELGVKNPWLLVLSYHKCTSKIRWLVLDLHHFTWHSIPDMPCKDKACPLGFRVLSYPFDGTLFVCGGMISDVDCSLDILLRFEMHKNRWTVMNKMINSRSFFAASVINGLIYVAGGSTVDRFETDSAEVYDPKDGNWRHVAPMNASMAVYDSAVINSKLLVTEGWLWPFTVSPRGEVYDPRCDRWTSMPPGLREGWTGASVVLYGQLFVVSEHERMKLKAYQSESDTWMTVDGPPLPEEICKPFAVNGDGVHVYVVGRNLHVAVGRIHRFRCSEKWTFSVRWALVGPPDNFFDLAPSDAQVLFA